MSTSNTKKTNTLCVHAGEIEDIQFQGAVSPLFPSTSYAFLDGVEKRYPRNFNTPNQVALNKKIAALEQAETALVFGSGMAAISTALFAFLHQGDHIVLQQTLYGGTFHLVTDQFKKFGIEYSFTDGLEQSDFIDKIKPNTKVVYIETPSNPLLTITDIEMVAKLAKKRGLITMIDNTFATPIGQQPIALGIDIVIHSATKYMGGHSDILAGAIATSNKLMETIHNTGRNFGGNLSDYTVWLLERSMKTLGLRVKAQNRNAKKLAKFLDKHPKVERVYYPGLKSHPGHDIAKKQMHGFGGMISFELKDTYNPEVFMKHLEIVKPSLSLAGVESTILSPALTSHFLVPKEEREKQGVTEGLLRFSVGIEDKNDLMADLEQALEKL